MLSSGDKILIKNLWECKRFSARSLLKEFPNKNWKLAKNTAHLVHTHSCC